MCVSFPRLTELVPRYHRLMRERGVDFLLCPTYVGVAAELGTAQYWGYTSIWNILDQPAVVFPTGLKADPQIDVAETDYTPRNETDEREFKKCTLGFPPSPLPSGSKLGRYGQFSSVSE